MRPARLTPPARGTIPNEVVGKIVEDEMTPIRAWREYLGLTQAEVAARLEVSQAAFAQFEAPDAKPRKRTLERIAEALGITVGQLKF
jgi:predicted transcriptional regulator